MNNQQLSKQQIRIIIILVIVFFIGTIGYSVATLISRRGKIPITIQFAPYSATVKIDDKKVRNNHENYIAPGEHTITVAADEFETYTGTITVNESTNNIFGMLTPATEKGQQIAISRQREFSEVEAISSSASIEAGIKEETTWPILQYLPIDKLIFNIGYTMENQNNLVVVINTDITYINPAIDYLTTSEIGSTPLEDYNIVISNYQNPLTNTFVNNQSLDPLEFLRTGYSNIDCEILPGKEEQGYYYTIINTGSSENYTIVSSRVILTKNGSYWKLASTPYPILTTSNTPGIPNDILRKANNLSSSPSL